jgi:hypothetical protein
VLHVYLTGQALVDEVKTHDSIVTPMDGATLHDRTKVAVDGEVAQAELRQLNNAHGVGLVVDVEADHIAHLADKRHWATRKEYALRTARVEEETILSAVYLYGQENAPIVKLYVDGISEIRGERREE